MTTALSNGSGRGNQRLRTRKDLLAAAARLLKEGRSPSMEDVAAEAMVSRATAYRYFPTVEALLTEAPLDGDTPPVDTIFAGVSATDPEERIDRAEAALHEMVYRNEAQLRLMLANSLERAAKSPPTPGIPLRQNRRLPMIQSALAPAREQFTDEAYERLCAALCLIFGTESMVVFNDVLGLDADTAREVKSWAAKALVRVAREESTKT